jgi:hypothetical protein
MIVSDIFWEIDGICIDVVRTLLKLPTENEYGSQNATSSMVIPKKSNDKSERLSEQEIRFLFVKELERREINYSVETPTIKKYNFTDSGNKRSGSLDLTIFHDVGHKLERLCNIEFKSGTQSCKNDFEKLLREEEEGVFIHFVSKCDKSTLTSGLDKIDSKNQEEESIQKGILAHYKEDFIQLRKTVNDIELDHCDRNIKFIILSLNPAFIITKTIKKSDLLSNNDHFDIEYSIEKGKLNFKPKDLMGWDLIFSISSCKS